MIKCVGIIKISAFHSKKVPKEGKDLKNKNSWEKEGILSCQGKNSTLRPVLVKEVLREVKCIHLRLLSMEGTVFKK